MRISSIIFAVSLILGACMSPHVKITDKKTDRKKTGGAIRTGFVWDGLKDKDSEKLQIEAN